MRPEFRVLQGDCLELLRTLPDESVHACVTSPPYWCLRAYPGVDPAVYGGNPRCSHEWEEAEAPRQHHGRSRGSRGIHGSVRQPAEMGVGAVCRWCGAWRGCLGAEPTIDRWVANLVEVFGEVRRVLRSDGTLWLQLGDKWNCSVNGWRRDDPRRRATDDRHYASDAVRGAVGGLALKQLMLLPQRLALALQADGWWVRQWVTWEKPNAKPDHRKDLPGCSSEWVLLLSRSPGYHYDAYGEREACPDAPGGTRHLRDVWSVCTERGHAGHSAAFPVALAQRCIRLATSAVGCCSQCGAPFRRVLRDVDPRPKRFSTAAEQEAWNAARGRPGKSGCVVPPHTIGRERAKVTVGWEATCRHGAGVEPCLVLDPFSGSGTTGVAALQNGRSYLGIELSGRYVASSLRRLAHVTPPIEVREEPEPERPRQLELLSGDEEAIA